MGWFSSKTKHYVDTQISRAISDENLSDPKAVAIIEGILMNDQSPATSLMNASIHGPARSFEKMYRYARKGPENNGYIFGLPNLTIRSSAEKNSQVKDIIETKENKEVTIDYLYFSGINIFHKAYEYLAEELDFNKNTNELEKFRRVPNINTQNDIWLNYPAKPDNRITQYYYVDKIIAHHITSEQNPLNPASVNFWNPAGAENINQPINVEGYSEEFIRNTEGQQGGLLAGAGQVPNPDSLFESDITNTDEAGNENAVEGFTIKYYWDEKTPTYDPPVSEHTAAQKRDTDFIPAIAKVTTVRKYGEIYVSLEEYDRTKEYFQACYFYDEVPDTDDNLENNVKRIWKYFTYLPGTGRYPVLDIVNRSGYSSLVPEDEQFFPIASLISTSVDERGKDVRVDHTVEPSDPDSEEYKRFKSTQKLLDYIQVDLETIGESLRDQEEDEDGNKQDMDDISQAIIMMGVPLETENELELEYLYYFFNDIYDRMPEDTSVDGVTRTDRSYSMEIGDADYSTVISFDNIRKEIKEGSIGDYNTFDALPAEEIPPTEDANGFLGDIVNEIRNAVTESKKNKTIRRQILEADGDYPGLYEEITIYNPMFKTTVKELKKKDLIVEGGVNDERLLIPVNYSISRRMSYFDREMLYMRSLHFVFNSHVTQKVKWWQRGAFKILLIIIAVVISYYTMGIGGELFLAATASAMAMVMIKFIVTLVVQMILMDLAFRFVVEQLGVDVAMIIAAIAIAYGGYKAGQNIAANGLKSITSSAMKYIEIATGLFNAVGTEYQNKIGILQEEYAAWMEEAEERMEELDALRAELINPVDIDPLLFMRRTKPMTILGEPPDSFYARTVENSNPGVKSIESLESFYEIATMLPKTTV